MLWVKIRRSGNEMSGGGVRYHSPTIALCLWLDTVSMGMLGDACLTVKALFRGFLGIR